MIGLLLLIIVLLILIILLNSNAECFSVGGKPFDPVRDAPNQYEGYPVPEFKIKYIPK